MLICSENWCLDCVKMQLETRRTDRVIGVVQAAVKHTMHIKWYNEQFVWEAWNCQVNRHTAQCNGWSGPLVCALVALADACG